MSITASGAEAPKTKKILFISEAHEKFYYEKLKEVRYHGQRKKNHIFQLSLNKIF